MNKKKSQKATDDDLQPSLVQLKEKSTLPVASTNLLENMKSKMALRVKK